MEQSMMRRVWSVLKWVLGLLALVLIVLPKVLAPMVEHRMQGVMQMLRQRGAPVSLVDYHRGWFVSTARLHQPNGPDRLLTIDHGPVLYRQRMALKLAGVNATVPTGFGEGRLVTLLGYGGGMQVNFSVKSMRPLAHASGEHGPLEASSRLPVVFDGYRMVLNISKPAKGEHLVSDVSGYMVVNGLKKDLPSHHAQFSVDQIRLNFKANGCGKACVSQHDFAFDFGYAVRGVHVPLGHGSMGQMPMVFSMDRLALNHLHMASVERWAAFLNPTAAQLNDGSYLRQRDQRIASSVTSLFTSQTTFRTQGVALDFDDPSMHGHVEGVCSVDLRHLPKQHDMLDVILMATSDCALKANGLRFGKKEAPTFSLEKFSIKGSSSESGLGTAKMSVTLSGMSSPEFRLPSLVINYKKQPLSDQRLAAVHSDIAMDGLCVASAGLQIGSSNKDLCVHQFKISSVTKPINNLYDEKVYAKFKRSYLSMLAGLSSTVQSVRGAHAGLKRRDTLGVKNRLRSLMRQADLNRDDTVGVVLGNAHTSMGDLKWQWRYFPTKRLVHDVKASSSILESGYIKGKLMVSNVKDKAFKAMLNAWVKKGYLTPVKDHYTIAFKLDAASQRVWLNGHLLKSSVDASGSKHSSSVDKKTNLP